MIKKTIKIISYITVGIIILVGIAFFTIRMIFPQEKVRAMITKKIETAIQHKVMIGNVSLTFSNIRLKDVIVFDTDEKTKQLFRAENMNVVFDFLPLLKKQVMINKVVIDNPILSIIRAENGSCVSEFFTSMQTKNSSILMALTLFVSDCKINNGTILCEDKSEKKWSKIHNIDLHLVRKGIVKPIEVKMKFDFKQKYNKIIKDSIDAKLKTKCSFDLLEKRLNVTSLEATVNRAKVKMSGDVNAKTKRFDLHCNAQDVPTNIAASFLNADRMDALKLSGTMNIDCSVEGTTRSVSINGTSDITNTFISYKDIFTKAQTLPAELEYRFVLKDKNLHFDPLDIRCEKSRLMAKGMMPVKGDIKNTDITLSTLSIELDRLSQLLPGIRPYEPTGRIGTTFHYVRGSWDATVSFNKAHLLSGNITYDDIDGSVYYGNDIYFDNIRGFLNKKPFSLDLKLFDVNSPTGTFQLKLDAVDLDEILANSNVLTPKTQPVFFPLPLEKAYLEGTVAIGTFTYANMVINGFSSNIIWKDKILRFDPIFAMIAGGKLTGKGSVTLFRFDEIDYLFDVKVSGALLEEFVQNFPNSRDKITGGITDSEIKLRGRAGNVKSIYSRGSFISKAGRFQKVPFMEGIANATKVSELKNPEFTKTSFNYELKDGKMATQDFIMTGPLADVSGRGNFDVVTKNINAKIKARMSKKASGTGLIADILKDEEGRVVHNLTVNGKVDNPRYTYIVPEKTGQNLIQEGLKFLQQESK